MPTDSVHDVSAREQVLSRAPLEAWFLRHRRSCLAAIVIIALALRVVCYLELAPGPYFALHDWPDADMNYFHTWAGAIAEGDWWSRGVRPPHHPWHGEVARGYARSFPDRWQALLAQAPGGDSEEAARLLWDRWCGGGRFYQGPLYAYLAALTFGLPGSSVGWVFAWQALLGVGSTVLIYLLARRFFGDVAAVTSAILALLYGPLLFYEFALLRTTLIVFAGLALALLLEWARRKRTVPACLCTGLVLGASLMLKAHFGLMVLGGVVLLVAACWRQWSRLGWCLGVLSAGLLVGFGPVVVRNMVVGVSPLVTATGGPATFVTANTRDADYGSMGLDHAGRILGESGNAFLPAAVAALKTHPSPTSYLGLLWAKVLAMGHWYEIPNNTNYHYGRLHSRVLRALPVSFGVIGPLGVVGLVLALRPRRRCGPLLLLLMTNLAVVLLFFVYARFRLPLAAALLPFAGLTVSCLAAWVKERRWSAAGLTLAVLAVLAAHALGPLDPGHPVVRPVDVIAVHQHYYAPRIEEALSRGDWAAATDLVDRMLSAQPAVVRGMGDSRPARSPEQAALARLYAQAHRNRAELSRRAGRSEQARVHLRRAEELKRAAALAPRR